MPGYRLDLYINLGTKLSVLRNHYAVCEGLEVKDVLEWTGFFLKWSQDAMETGGDWAKHNLLTANRLAVEIAQSKSGPTAAVSLTVAMADAAKGLDAEIMAFTMPTPELKRA